jgi:hypothetical protein
MANAITQYVDKLAATFGAAWNRFWFTPGDPLTVCVLRIVAGTAALFYVATFSFDLIDWFGPTGWLPVETVQRVMETSPGEGAAYQPSYFNRIQSPALLWTVHAIGIVITALFALGLFTRVTAVLSLVVVLSYIHRAPLIAAHFEPVVAMMIFYLCFTPCGRYLSLDRRLGPARPAPLDEGLEDRSWTANAGLRLIQINVAGLYLMMGLAKLGSTTWWEGGAMWWLMAQSQSRLVDLTFLRGNRFLYLINAWTHAVVLFELCYGVLIWNRLARPLLIAVSVVMWTLTALVTGLVPYCLLMIATGAAFVPAEIWRLLWKRNRDEAHDAGLPGEKKEAVSV